MRALLLILAACASSPSTPIAPVAATPSAPVVAPTKPVAAELDAVDLADAGAQPRQPLRYHFTAGSTELMDMDMKMTMAMAFDDPTLGARSSTSALPTVRSRIRIDVTELTPEGDARLAFNWLAVTVLPDVKVDAKMRHALESELGGLVGTRATARVSTRGATSDIAFVPAPNMTPTMRSSLGRMTDSLRQLYLPFPGAAVGAGARWTIVVQVPFNGIAMDATYRYRLVELTAATARCDIKVTMSAAKQPMEVGSGMTGQLDSLTGHGEGTMTFTFDRLTPVGGTHVASDAAFSIATGDTVLTAKMHVDALVGTRPAK